MQAVRSRDTTPEITVRRVIHALGYRYRLHVRSLPGCPDLVFPSRKKLIFVHGCFWHGHSCRAGVNRPRSNQDYWLSKLDRNKARDARNTNELRKLGWKTLTVWECQLKNVAALEKKIYRFLSV